MDSDQLIIEAVTAGHLIVDHNAGIVYRTRGSKGVALDNPVVVDGCNLNGYRVCKLVLNGYRKMIRLHRIIWVSANGAIPDGLMIDHINRDRVDNRIANLRLVDAKGNAQNRDHLTGELNPLAKLTYDQVSEIRFIYDHSDMSVRDISNAYGISKSQIHNIISNNSWKNQPPSEYWDGDWQRGVSPVGSRGAQRASRLKALGNAIVPQVAYQIFKAIAASSALPRESAKPEHQK